MRKRIWEVYASSSSSSSSLIPAGERGGPIPRLMLGGGESLASIALLARSLAIAFFTFIFPFLLLLLLLQQQVLREEELEGGAVDAIVAGQGRHHSKRHWSSQVPVRDCAPQRLGLGRFPGSGGFCARRPTCFSCSSTSLGPSTRCARWWRPSPAPWQPVVRT